MIEHYPGQNKIYGYVLYEEVRTILIQSFVNGKRDLTTDFIMCNLLDKHTDLKQHIPLSDKSTLKRRIREICKKLDMSDKIKMEYTLTDKRVFQYVITEINLV